MNTTPRPQPLTPDFERIPPALRDTPAWVLWEYRRDDKGKWTKVPLTIRRHNASTTNPTSWAPFDAVRQAYQRGGFDGVGIVLTDGIAGVDIDKAIDDDGAIEPWAKDALDRFPNTYREKSPSGRGFRIFARGQPKRCGKGGPENHLEIYAKGSPRYLTVTGHALDDVAEIADAQPALDWLHVSFMEKVPKRANSKANAGTSGAIPDDEVIRRAREARNGAKFLRLYGGDASGHSSQSEADAALIGILAFWTQDAAQLDRLFRRSGLMRDKWNERRGDSTYGADTIANILRKGGARFADGATGGAGGADASERQAGDANAPAGDSDGDAWPEPEPLTADDEAQPYPLDALPAGIREAVAEVVAFVQCPPALAACSALSALSLAGQGLADVQRAEQLQGPISLYLLAVAESGERKTACDGYFLRPIREWERAQAEATRGDAARSVARIEAWESKRSGIKERIKETTKKRGDTTEAERELAALQSERPEPFRVPALILNDVTPEALAFTLATEWPSGGIMSSEAGIVFGGHAMGRETVMRNLALLNALWDGASHKVKRRTSEHFEVRGARLTMGLAAQPETVRQFMEGTKGLARGNGFAARFLIAAPVSTQGARPFKEAPSWEHLGAFAGRLGALLALPANVDMSGALALPLLTMTPEARDAWIAFHNEVEAELAPGGDMAETKDVASKAADNVARMAALFHLYAHGPTGQVSPEAVTAAARIVAWHLYQARAFLGDVAAPPERSNARHLDAWLRDYCQRESAREVERRTVQQRGPGCVRGRLALDAALAELVEARRAREVKRGARKLVEVNPTLLRGSDGAP